MTDLSTRLAAEAARIEEDTEHSSKSHYNASNRWARYHLFIGLPSAMIAALGGVAVLNSCPQIALGMALISSALTTVLTFLKPSERAEMHKVVAGQYLALRNRARLFREIELKENSDLEVSRTRLLTLASERDELNQQSPTISRRDYELAKEDIDTGRTRYRVDGGEQ